jgi:hypothetical protein
MRTLWVLVPLLALLLVVQYIAGMWTNAYAPSAGFTNNSSFLSLNIHYMVGDVLGVLSIVLVIVAAFSRRLPFVAISVVTLAAVIVAGFAGMAFVSSSPNNPADTMVMALAFIVAFGAILGFAFRLVLARAVLPPATTAPTA